jgi:hypothetical protein
MRNGRGFGNSEIRSEGEFLYFSFRISNLRIGAGSGREGSAEVFWGAEKGFDLGGGAGVEDVFAAEPALAGDADAETDVVEAGGGMGIGVDGAKHSEVPGATPPAPVEVEA